MMMMLNGDRKELTMTLNQNRTALKRLMQGKYDPYWDRPNFVNERNHDRFENNLKPEWDNKNFNDN